MYCSVYNIYSVFVCLCMCMFRYKKVDKQLTHVMHVKDRYENGNVIDKLTKWHQLF